MKKNKLFWMFGAAAALSFAACSNDDAVEAPDNGATNGDGATAYMSVVINAAGETRATSGEDVDDFEQSTTEHEVDNANFYFYTAEGAYVTTAEIWDGDADNEDDDADNDNNTNASKKNIEFKGKTVLVLKDLNEANAPAYMVTVLNAPAGFTPGNTLAKMAATLALAANDADGYAYPKDDKTYFMMSTSSYIRTAPANDYEYFTTKVDPATFLQYKNGATPTQEQIDLLTPVEIYVERLAVKVRVNYAATLTNQVTVGGKTYFKLTVSGGNVTNTEDESVSIPVADVDLYLAIEGWGLNNLTQNSYMMKNLTDQTATSWHNGSSNSAAGLFRNYWAKAAKIYGSTDSDAENPILARYALKDYLTSYDADLFDPATATFKLTADDPDYCFENTNDATMTSANLGKLATSAMIFARIYQATKDDAGTITAMTPTTMISYNGIMFTADDFKAMVLNAIQNNTASSAKKYAYKTTDASYNDVYTSIGADDIEFVAGGEANKGEVTIHLTTTAAEKNWHTYTGATLPTDAAGFTATNAADVNTALENVIKNTNSDVSAKAYMYTGGLMYYNVPIEHYRNATPATPFVEGDYGVVRNHIYQLSINNLTKLGKAIYNPEQVIIPDTPTDEDRYALGVRVNIHSWKIVKQSVAL